MNTENLIITLGKEGSLIYDGNNLATQNSFKSEIVDTIGAGTTEIQKNTIAKKALNLPL